MAKIVYDPLVQKVRGRIAGNVHTSDGTINVLRTFVSTANPRTAKQEAVRAAFTLASKAWAKLTDAQRGAWDLLAKATKVSDPLSGKVRTLNGHALYVRLNANLATIGLPEIADAPGGDDSTVLAGGFPAVWQVVKVGTAAAPLDNVSAFLGAAALDHAVAVYAAKPLSPGRMAVPKGKFSKIGVLAKGALPNAQNLMGLYAAGLRTYPDAAAGQKFLFKFVKVSESGFASAPVEFALTAGV